MFDPTVTAAPLVVVSRFRVPADQAAAFAADARAAIEVLADCAGFQRASLGQSTDDAGLRAIVTEWDGVGSYRRALSRYEVKASAIPFLSHAIDEPSAYEVVHARTPGSAHGGPSGLAADAGSVGLGQAAGPAVSPVTA
ncbi:MAG: antibiotic biosynthesis monooxygenase [Actinomycetales bacterium]|nr:antibiotic biosynthesis monooxygenase [Actinomycetales bacterium]